MRGVLLSAPGPIVPEAFLRSSFSQGDEHAIPFRRRRHQAETFDAIPIQLVEVFKDRHTLKALPYVGFGLVPSAIPVGLQHRVMTPEEVSKLRPLRVGG